MVLARQPHPSAKGKCVRTMRERKRVTILLRKRCRSGARWRGREGGKEEKLTLPSADLLEASEQGPFWTIMS